MFSHITNVLKTKYKSQEKRKRSNSTVYLLQNQENEIQEKLVQQNCNHQEHYKEESQKQQQKFLGPDIDVNISSPILRNRRNGMCEKDMQKDITEVRLKVLLKSMEGCVW